MRNLLAGILVLGWALLPVSAQQFRIVTWQVPDVEIPKEINGVQPPEPRQIKTIAAALESVEPDIIILYGISDWEALSRIADAMRRKKFSVASLMVDRLDGSKSPIIGQPVAILSRRQRMANKNFDWRETGRIDFPGGFTFATFRHGIGGLAVMVANLPGSLTNGVGSSDGEYYFRKRGYAAEYLAHHASWLATTYTNEAFATYLTGDINLTSKKPVKDDCASILENGGFRAVSTGPTFDKTTYSVTNGAALNRVFDPVFTKGVEFISSRQLVRPAPEQPMVICEITVSASGSTSILSRPRHSKPISTPQPATPRLEPLVETTPPAPLVTRPAPEPTATPIGLFFQQHWVWPAMGGIAFALLAFIVMGVRRSKRRNTSSALARRPNESVFLEMNSPMPRPEKPSIAAGSQAVLSEPTTATDNAHNVSWQKSSVRVETGSGNETDATQSGLMPHLKRLMREKLFIWLSHQRTQLIDSQETGTEKVLGLEERLEKIQDQFQDRLIEQQQRIAELDKELQAKEKQITEAKKVKDNQDKQRSNN